MTIRNNEGYKTDVFQNWFGKKDVSLWHVKFLIRCCLDNNLYHYLYNYTKPARIAQLDKMLDLKTRGCRCDSRAGQPNEY